jgi:flagellar FliJ protein
LEKKAIMATDKINKVATLAESRERNSAGVFKQSRQSHEQQRQQFDQLIQFKQEYETRLGQVGEQGIPARQLQDYRLFLNKLNQAIEQQRAAVSDSAQQLEGDREQWMTEARHKTAINKALRNQERAEQRDADEKSLARKSLEYPPR